MRRCWDRPKTWLQLQELPRVRKNRKPSPGRPSSGGCPGFAGVKGTPRLILRCLIRRWLAGIAGDWFGVTWISAPIFLVLGGMNIHPPRRMRVFRREYGLMLLIWRGDVEPFSARFIADLLRIIPVTKQFAHIKRAHLAVVCLPQRTRRTFFVGSGGDKPATPCPAQRARGQKQLSAKGWR